MMRSKKFWSFILRHISAEVPDEMSACLDCGATQCTNAKYQSCPNRLAHAAALTAWRKEAAEGSGSPAR